MNKVSSLIYKFDEKVQKENFEAELMERYTDGIVIDSREDYCVKVYYVPTEMRFAMRLLEQLNAIAAQCGYGYLYMF